MKKLKQIISPRRLSIILIILVLLFTLPYVNEPAQSRTEAIVTMLCIDKEDEMVKVATTFLSPGQEKKANYNVYTGEGETLGNALSKIAVATGKDLGFAQCDVVGVGENLWTNEIMQTLDFVTRTKRLDRNALLVAVEGDIEDFSNAIINLSSQKSIKLAEVINFDKNYLLGSQTDIAKFYKGYFGKTAIGIMPKISINGKEENNAIEVQAGGSSSQSAGQMTTQSDTEKKYLMNDGSIVVFKHGRMKTIANSEIVRDINYVVKEAQMGNIIVKNVTDDLYTDATVVVDLLSKDITFKTKFENDLPVMNIKLDLIVRVDEVHDKKVDKKILRRNDAFLTEELVRKLEEKVRVQVEEGIAFCKTNDVDIIECYKFFNAFHYKSFQKYIESVGGVEHFLDDIQFNIDIRVMSAA